MAEKITKLSKKNCKLVITTEREFIKWTAWLEIHPKKIKYICDFTVDGNIVGTDVIQQYIGQKQSKKSKLNLKIMNLNCHVKIYFRTLVITMSYI